MSGSASASIKSNEADVPPSVDLRASVLDAAINLGIRNSTVARWMFEPVAEADEEEVAERSTPGLTSPSTSEESAMSPWSFRAPLKPSYPYQNQENSDKDRSQPVDTFVADSDIAAVRTGRDVVDVGTSGRATPSKLTLAVPLPRNKLKKQRMGNGYESDGGYLSDSGRTATKPKTKRNIGWRRKDREKEEEDGESDGGYLSEAVTGAGEVKKVKRKAKTKPKSRADADGVPSPTGLDERDPTTLLATINANFLPESESGHGADGYATDSVGTEKRGRSKKKSKEKEKEKRGTPPPNGSGYAEEDQTNAPTKKKSLFRLRMRSASRDAKDKDRDRTPVNEVPPPLPPLPPPQLPQMPLPIAERFARSRAGTPTPASNGNGNEENASGKETANTSPTVAYSQLIPPGPNLGLGLMKSSSAVELGQTQTSLGTSALIPSSLFLTTTDSLALRSDSPWSFRSAPSRMGGVASSPLNSGGRPSEDVWTKGRSSTEDSGRTGAGKGMSDGAKSPITEDAGTFSKSRPSEDGVYSSAINSNNGPLHLTRSASPLIGDVASVAETRSPGRKLGRLFTFGHSSNSNANGNNSSKLNPAISISAPNPHLDTRLAPSPLDIAAALTAKAGSPTTVKSDEGPRQGMMEAEETKRRESSFESFIVIEEDEGVSTPVEQMAFKVENKNSNGNGTELPSPSTLLSSPQVPFARPSSPSSGLSSLFMRRRGVVPMPARVPVKGPDDTPTQSRADTPTQSRAGTPTLEELTATRASVLAYYQVPPPSPPPTGPLPLPPPLPSSASASLTASGLPAVENENVQEALTVPRRPSEDRDRTLLSPGRVLTSRSPSPLSPGSTYIASRSPSPSMMMGGGGGGMRTIRGRESPFPTRPVLPPQNSRELVSRVERYKALYATDPVDDEDEGGETRENAEEEYVDRHSSAYIREARARGEKRVYFDIRHSQDGKATDAFRAPPEIDIEDVDEYGYHGGEYAHGNGEREPFDEDGDERLRYAREALGSDEWEEGETPVNRRSAASMSVYSSYSVLDADQSAQVRDGLVRRVAALYGRGAGDEGEYLREEIPEVPKLPNANVLNAIGKSGAGRPLGGVGKDLSSIKSSPYRF